MDGANDPKFRSLADVDDTFAEAVVHSRRHIVLGFRLRPFNFWHAANLDFICSPFAGHNKPLDFAALYIAARICQLRYPATFRRRKLEWFIELLKARKYRYFKMFRQNEQNEKPQKHSVNSVQKNSVVFPFLQELNKFSAYMRDYISRPEYVSSDESVPVKSPWYLYEVCLLRRFNPDTTWAQCWDTPVGWASWHNAAMLEATGNKIDILTPEIRKALTQMEQMQNEVEQLNRVIPQRESNGS